MPHPHSITIIIHNNRSWYGPFASNWGSWAGCSDCTLSTHPSVLTGSSIGHLPELRVIAGHGPLAEPIMALVSTPITCNHRSWSVCPHIPKSAAWLPKLYVITDHQLFWQVKYSMIWSKHCFYPILIWFYVAFKLFTFCEQSWTNYYWVLVYVFRLH